MKIYKLTLLEVTMTPGKPMEFTPILVEHYKSRETANQKKTETLAGLAELLGTSGKYQIEVQEIDVKE